MFAGFEATAPFSVNSSGLCEIQADADLTAPCLQGLQVSTEKWIHEEMHYAGGSRLN